MADRLPFNESLSRRWQTWDRRRESRRQCSTNLCRRCLRARLPTKASAPSRKYVAANVSCSHTLVPSRSPAMSITAQCSECGSEYRLREEFEGKKVRCKKCGAEFRVAADAEQQVVAVSVHQDDEDDTEAATERPRKPLKKDGDGERPRRKKVAKEKGFRTVAGFVALIGLAVAFLVGLGFLFYFMTAKEIEQKITDADRAAVLTADQIDPKISGGKIPSGAGTFHKIRDRYGKYILTYTYGAADESMNSFFVETTITIAPYESEAEVVYTRASGAMALGTGWEGKTVPKKIDVNKM